MEIVYHRLLNDFFAGAEMPTQILNMILTMIDNMFTYAYYLVIFRRRTKTINFYLSLHILKKINTIKQKFKLMCFVFFFKYITYRITTKGFTHNLRQQLAFSHELAISAPKLLA